MIFGKRDYWGLLICGVLLLALTLRIAQFTNFPPGIIHDEVWNWLNDQLILQGDIRPLYDVGGGREALYAFVQASFLNILGDNLIAMRLPSIMASVGLVAVTYALGRRWFGMRAGLVAMLLVTLSAWAILFGRLGVRTGSLPFVTALGFYWLYRVLEDPLTVNNRRYFLAAGILLGATWYIYPVAWGLPFAIGPLLLYLVLFERTRVRERWRGLLLAMGVWIVAGALLFIYIGTHPTTFARAEQVNQPLEALLAGDPVPVLSNIPFVLQTFTILGDHGLEYNMQWRPLFPEPITAMFFYFGLAVITVNLLRRGRSKRLPYLLLLLWLFASLVPTFLTSDPLNSSRLIGLAGPTFLVAGLGAQNLWSLLHARWGKNGHRLAMAVIGVALVLNLYLTLSDLAVWNANPVVRFLYQSDLRDIARALDASTETTSVVIAGLTPHTIDPVTMRILMNRDDLPLRFFGGANELEPLVHGLLLPDDDEVHVYVPHAVSLQPELSNFLDASGERMNAETYTSWTIPSSITKLIEDKPLARGSLVDLLAVSWHESTDAWMVQTQWKAHGSSDDELRIFIHLVNSTGEIVAQYDGLQVPSTQWVAGDHIWHWHMLALPEPLAVDDYVIRVGLYNPSDGVRMSFADGTEFAEVSVVFGD